MGIYLVFDLSRDLFNLIKKRERIENMEDKIEELALNSKELKERLEYVQSDEFVEKEARDKLNMAKEDEIIVVLPEDFKVPDFQASKDSTEDLPNWQQWLKLFF